MSSRDLLPDHPAELTLLEYLVGDLPAETCDRIRRHVASCRACRRTVADLSLTVDELDRLPTVPIPHDTPAARRRRRRLRLTRVVPVVAVLMAVGAVVGVLAPGRDRPARDPFRTRVALGPDGTPVSVLRSRLAAAEPLHVEVADGRGEVVVVVTQGELERLKRRLVLLSAAEPSDSRVVAVEVVTTRDRLPLLTPDTGPVAVGA